MVRGVELRKHVSRGGAGKVERRCDDPTSTIQKTRLAERHGSTLTTCRTSLLNGTIAVVSSTLSKGLARCTSQAAV